MAEKIEIKAHDDHIDTLTDLRKNAAKVCGTTKSPEGYAVPDTTANHVEQFGRWFHSEYTRARLAKPWNKDPAQGQWEANYKRIIATTKNADPDALYPHNHWFWNTALLKLAIYLQAEKTKPSPMDIFMESLEESVDDRVQNVRDFIEGAGEVASDAVSAVSRAAEAVSEAGDRAWSGIKIAAIVGASLVGAAIIVPPIIRARRD